MTKFNDQYLKKNRPNHECINPKLNGNEPILQMAIRERGITQKCITQRGMVHMGRKLALHITL